MALHHQDAGIRDVMSDITEDYDLRASTSQDLFILEDALPIQQQQQVASNNHNNNPSRVVTNSFASPPRRSNRNNMGHYENGNDDNPPPTFLSPFSSKALQLGNGQDYDDEDNEMYQLSLHATRPVSIVVHVTNPTNSTPRIPCVFPPLVALEGKLSNDDASSIMTDDNASNNPRHTADGNNKNNNRRKPPPPSPTTATLTAAEQTKDLVIINPTAFGVALPNQVSLDILNSITRVARISSEDWVRLYRFHQVWWPRGMVQGMDRLATAVAHRQR